MKKLSKSILEKILNTQLKRNFSISGVCIDTRILQPGDIFIAIKGTRVDGHDYAINAFKSGASYIIVSNQISEEIPNDRIIKVENTLISFWKLAKWYRETYNPFVIAVTGSIGKTSVKDCIAAILSVREPTLSSAHSFNNHIGVPLTLTKLNSQIHYLVQELGMNHFGEIHELSLLAKPDLAYINNVYPTHLQYMKSVAGIIKAKLEIISGLTGTLWVNGDQEDLVKEANKRYDKVKTFGLDNDSDIKGLFHNEQGILEIKGIGEFRIDAMAKPQASNILGGIAVVSSLGLSYDEINSGLAALSRTPGRLNMEITNDNIRIINDTYNASPYSIKLAFEVLSLPKWGSGRRIAVLGDMKELGKDSAFWHKTVGSWAKKFNIDLLLVTGEEARYYLDNWTNGTGRFFSDKSDLTKTLVNIAKPNDVILFKGSRITAMEKVINGFKNSRYA